MAQIGSEVYRRIGNFSEEEQLFDTESRAHKFQGIGIKKIF